MTAASRSYVRTLMGDIAADQNWGVGAAGARPRLKNGWLNTGGKDLTLADLRRQITIPDLRTGHMTYLRELSEVAVVERIP